MALGEPSPLFHGICRMRAAFTAAVVALPATVALYFRNPISWRRNPLSASARVLPAPESLGVVLAAARHSLHSRGHVRAMALVI